MNEIIPAISDISHLRALIRSWREAGERISLVPTMGNLHEGHLALVSEAKRRTSRCVVSIFVNPMQFGAGEDYEHYPRTLAEDQKKLAVAGIDLLFAPEVKTIYPRGEQAQTWIEVPGISNILCGASRPKHFVGVATVVCKFFNMVQPDLAVFGEKDYQQLLVIRRMVADLAIPIEILGMATVREDDGLAKSSRNSYLSFEQRALAPKLYQTLRMTADAILAGDRDFVKLERNAQKYLNSLGFLSDYYTIRNARNLMPATPEVNGLVILAAAYLENTRLIDNLLVEI
jgi:pantoate--beta-alanine ligase